MKEIARSRTVLVIAHRLSTVRETDRIITIDRGRLVEDGTHDGRPLCVAAPAAGRHP
jgi:subfamily B ATP-binding cassette protein HlyB/CyaB